MPGLANAEVHIGFNSAWFIPEALFGWGRYLGSPLQVLNPVLIVVVGCHFLGGLNRHLQRRARPGDLLRSVLLLLLFELSGDLSSLSPDLATAVLLLVALTQVIELPAPRPGQPLPTPQVLVLLLCLFTCTVKFSALPILLLPAWWLIRSGQWRQGRWLLRLSVGGLALAGPWLARNILLSGYPLYPLALLPLPVRWRFPAAELALHGDYITAYARNPKAFELVLHQHWWHWLPGWWQQQHFDNKLLLLSIAGLLPLAVGLAWRRYQYRSLGGVSRQLVAALIALLGVVFWAVIAPAIRFGQGFLLAALALLLLPWLWKLWRRWPRLIGNGIGLATLAYLTLYPLGIHVSHFLMPKALTKTGYMQLLHQLPAAPDQVVMQEYYCRVRHDSVVALLPAPRLLRWRVALLALKVAKMPRQCPVDSSRSRLFGWSRRLLLPARYPVVVTQPLRMGSFQATQSLQDQRPWYAPFPFVARRNLCQANGPSLSDGFRARVPPGPQNWCQLGMW